jgi:uncharacterized protein involved in tellurium resistance
VKINGVTRLKQPQEAKITVENKNQHRKEQESTIKMMIGEENAAEKKRLQNRYWIVTTFLLWRRGA